MVEIAADLATAGSLRPPAQKRSAMVFSFGCSAAAAIGSFLTCAA
ncbi:MAG: hypothetical protein ACREWE_05475 [Gammaproteobacteria bacterium]